MVENYKKKVVSASLIVTFGYGLSQVIRLAGNLVLTRLLVPEMFGIVSIANTFLTAIALFSDFGINQCVIKSNRSDDPVFLDTAWTIQVLRGVVLGLIAFLIATPVARFYNISELKRLLPVLGISTVLSGFTSTSIILLERDFQQKQLQIMQIISQIVGLVIVCIFAYKFRTVWALILGNFVSAIIQTIYSYLINDYRHKLIIDKESFLELMTFGKWILFSTAMMFLARQTDRILLGKIFNIRLYGIYNIAITFAELPKNIIQTLSGKVMYPLFAKYSSQPRSELRKQIRAVRKKFIYLIAVCLALFINISDYIIIFLYDERYTQAAWMLPVLAIGMWPFILISVVDRSLLAVGNPKYIAFGNLVKFVYMVVLTPIVSKLYGELGVIICIAFNDILSYIVVNYGLWKEKLSQLKQDLYSTLVFFLATAVFLIIRLILGLGIPGFLYYSV